MPRVLRILGGGCARHSLMNIVRVKSLNQLVLHRKLSPSICNVEEAFGRETSCGRFILHYKERTNQMVKPVYPPTSPSAAGEKKRLGSPTLRSFPRLHCAWRLPPPPAVAALPPPRHARWPTSRRPPLFFSRFPALGSCTSHGAPWKVPRIGRGEHVLFDLMLFEACRSVYI